MAVGTYENTFIELGTDLFPRILVTVNAVAVTGM